MKYYIIVLALFMAACGGNSEETAEKEKSENGEQNPQQVDSSGVEKETDVSETIETTIINESSTFNEVTIGEQVWMTKNLNVEKFRNGDPIPELKTDEEWEKASKNEQAAWCYYDNDPGNGEKYGKLYNWYAVNDPRGLAPEGWHIPSDNEWTDLTEYLGGEEVAGKKIKSEEGWKDNGNGSNKTGFSGLPGGGRGSSGKFGVIGSFGGMWSSTEGNDGGQSTHARARRLDNTSDILDINYGRKGSGLSVRCLKD